MAPVVVTRQQSALMATMQNRPLLVSSLIEHAATWHSHARIILKRPKKPSTTVTREELLASLARSAAMAAAE